MQHHRLYSIVSIGIALIFFSVSVTQSSAAGIYRPFGGRIIDAGAIGKSYITCGGAYGPLTINQFIYSALPSPYFIRTGTGGAPRTAGYILGLYRPTPSVGNCYNTESGAPVPAYEINLYGVSR